MTLARLEVSAPLPLDVYVRRPAGPLPFPLEEPNCRLFARGRHALWQGLRASGLQPGDEILVPAYHHGSEIEAIVRSGLSCRFYEASESLEPDERELESLLRPAVRALYLIHYLGFPQAAGRWRRWCDERGLLLLEDAAQAWLGTIDGRPLGSFGELAIYSLYKSFGVPDGGALLSRVAVSLPERERRLGAGALARRHAAWLAGRTQRLYAVALTERGPVTYRAEEDFELGDPATSPSAATMFLLPRVVTEDAAARRRAHYALLLDELADVVPPPFRVLPPGAAPFALPLLTDDKPSLRRRFEERAIGALDFWSIPNPALPVERYPGAASLRARIVAAPVHHELRPSDLERIATAVRPQRRGPVVRVEQLDGLDPLGGEWTRLAEQQSNIFGSWEWAALWWKHFGHERPLLASAGRSASGKLLAVVPLFLASERPLRVARFIGHGQADQLGPVAAPRDRALAARTLRECVREHDVDVFVGEFLPGDEGWSALLGATVVARAASPVLRPPDGAWEGLLASRSGNFREQVRRRERKLAREHELRYRLADDAARLQSDLDTLFGLHGARWHDDSGFGGADEAFHREFAACALERGWLRLWLLELDGRAAAAWYGFRFGGVESYYQAGRDPAWDKASVGFVLLAHSIRAALEDGMREYRFLRGGEGFKYRFANDDAGLETIALAGSRTGAAALAVLPALRRAAGPRRLQRWVG